ncbi:MAG: hypothetical protein N2443_04525 [Blastocatellia bacterium]|nr:hypothetical protein [Blastocatellia bacterium]
MSRVIRTVGELLYAPSRAFARIIRWSEIGGVALWALGITMLYESKLTGVFEQVRYLLSARGHWDAVSVRYLLSALREAVREGFGWLVVLVMVFVPLLLLFANAFSVRKPLLVLWREHYRQMLGAALYGWTVAHGVMILPVFLVLPEWAPRYEMALGIAVLPPFAFLVGIALRQALSISLVRTLAVLLPAIVSLAAVPVVGKAFVLLVASPVLVLIGHQLLTPYFHHVFAGARSSKEGGSRTRPHDAEAVVGANPPRAEGEAEPTEASCAEGRSSAV